MPDAQDMDLVREFARDGSETAFAEIVRRHLDLVYSVALRFVGNPADAQDVAQAVFIILARKAAGLRERTVLTGWLYETTRFTAARALRTRARRLTHEQEAFMESTLTQANTDHAWQQLAPHLEAAMARLDAADRALLALRFYEKKTGVEAAAALGIGADAAHKRTARALEKLRSYFTRHGIALTGAVIAGAISANSVQAAPVGMVKTISAVAAVKGATATTSTLALAKGALKIMAWTKVKAPIVAGAAILFTASVVTITAENSRDTHDGERYRITGDLVYQNSLTNFSRNFELTVNGNNWAIHATAEGGSIRYADEVCLNGSVYLYSHFGKPTGSPANNTGTASIEYGQAASVIAADPFIYYVWVGLASGGYFSQLTNGEAVPMITYLDKLPARWQLNDRFPYLPKSIDFLRGQNGGIILRPGVILHQFDSGWKVGELRVLQETNVNGQIFPSVFSYEGFRPKLSSSTNEVEHQFLATVTVRTIQLNSVPDVQTPKLNGETVVTDRRISDGPGYDPSGRPPGVVYFTTADHLPEKPDLTAIKKFKREMVSHSGAAGQRPFVAERPQKQKWIWLSAILIASVIAVIALMKRKSVKTK